MITDDFCIYFHGTSNADTRQLHWCNDLPVSAQEELQRRLDAVAGENSSLKRQLEASCRRNDQLQAALHDMENDIAAGKDREQELQRQVCFLSPSRGWFSVYAFCAEYLRNTVFYQSNDDDDDGIIHRQDTIISGHCLPSQPTALPLPLASSRLLSRSA